MAAATRNRPFVVAVSGIIGAGKSTMVEELGRLGLREERLKIYTAQEPVEDNFLLEKFYNDPHKYAFPMQMLLLHLRHDRQRMYSVPTNCDILLLDRCTMEDRCFAEMQHESGLMTDDEMRVYDVSSGIMRKNEILPDLVVKCAIEPSHAMERVRRRARTGEDKITQDYLERLQNKYDAVFWSKVREEGIPVVKTSAYQSARGDVCTLVRSDGNTVVKQTGSSDGLTSFAGSVLSEIKRQWIAWAY